MMGLAPVGCDWLGPLARRAHPPKECFEAEASACADTLAVLSERMCHPRQHLRPTRVMEDLAAEADRELAEFLGLRKPSVVPERAAPAVSAGLRHASTAVLQAPHGGGTLQRLPPIDGSASGVPSRARGRMCPASLEAVERRRSSGSPRAGDGSTRCECDPAEVLPQLRALSGHVEQRDLELRELRAQARFLVAKPPELTALVAENERLSAQYKDNAEQAAALRAEGSVINHQVDANRQWLVELQAERRRLFERIGDLESSEFSAYQRTESAESELEVERQRAASRKQSQEVALEVITEQEATASREAVAAQCAVNRLEIAQENTEVDRMAEQRAALKDAEREKQLTLELESQLTEYDRGGDERRQRRYAALYRELTEDWSRLPQLRDVEANLQKQLARSRCCGEEMEQKALSVTRELAESSQSVSWLRSEAATQQVARKELEEAQRRVERLRQSVLETAADAMNSGADDSSRGASQTLGARVQAARAQRARSDQIRSEQLRTVSEALRGSWEAETRNHRAAKRRLDGLKANLLPAQEHLLMLMEDLRLWREDLTKSSRLSSEWDVSSTENELPMLPADVDWQDTVSLPETAKALYSAFEAMAAETLRQLEHAESQSQGGELCSDEFGPQFGTTKAEGYLLREERLALQRELDRLTTGQGLEDSFSDALSDKPAPTRTLELEAEENEMRANALRVGANLKDRSALRGTHQRDVVEQVNPWCTAGSSPWVPLLAGSDSAKPAETSLGREQQPRSSEASTTPVPQIPGQSRESTSPTNSTSMSMPSVSPACAHRAVGNGWRGQEQVQPRARGHGTGVSESNQSLALPPSPLPQRSRLAVPGASSLHASSLRRSVSAGSIESLGRSTISDGWRLESRPVSPAPVRQNRTPPKRRSMSIASGLCSNVRASVLGLGAADMNTTLRRRARQIPVRSSLSVADAMSKQPSERFDSYSVHNPKKGVFHM